MLTIREQYSYKGKIYVQIIFKNVKDPDPGSDPELSEKPDPDPGSDPKKIIPDPQHCLIQCVVHPADLEVFGPPDSSNIKQNK
jgi:hypothetical protein